MNTEDGKKLEPATVVGGSRVARPAAKEHRKSEDKAETQTEESEEIVLQSGVLGKPMKEAPPPPKKDERSEVQHMHEKPQPSHQKDHKQVPPMIHQPR